MSLASACLVTLIRTLVVCLVAWPVCAVVELWLRELSDSWRRVALIGLLAPFCFPELLVGYAFRDLALAHPQWAELLCTGLLLVRVVPIGAVALLMAPPPECDAAAIHCQRMLLIGGQKSSFQKSRTSRVGASWLALAGCYWHGPVSRTLPALGLMAFVSFQEFELAALLMTTSWTDWFIAAERVGLERTEMLRQSLWPLLLQLPLLLGLLAWIGHEVTRRRDASIPEAHEHAFTIWSRIASGFASVYLVIAFLFGCVAPMMLIGWRTIDGLSLIAQQRTLKLGLLRESVISLAAAVCAGVTAWLLCRWLMRGRSQASPLERRGSEVDASSRNSGVSFAKPRSNPGHPAHGLSHQGQLVGDQRPSLLGRPPLGLLLLPGLMGSLLLSLGTVALFQLAWLRPLYNTPLPWLLALTVWLLPRAAVLQLWLEATRPGEAVYVAELAMSNEQRAMRQRVGSVCLGTQHSALIALLWRLRDQPTFLAMSLLCYWAYCDLPTAYLLAPTGMAPGLVRLYNFMHFGRSAALSGEACLFFGGPLVVILLGSQIVQGTRWMTTRQR